MLRFVAGYFVSNIKQNENRFERKLVYLTLIICFIYNGPIYRSRYGDLLRTGRSGDWIPLAVRFSAPYHTGPEAQPVSCKMSNGISWGWPFPCGPSWPVWGWPLPSHLIHIYIYLFIYLFRATRVAVCKVLGNKILPKGRQWVGHVEQIRYHLVPWPRNRRFGRSL
jgi:hypothetical protein